VRTITESLREMDAFGHFQDAQLELLAGCLSRVRYPAAVTIVKEGDPTQDAYLVERGRVRIQRDTPYGKFTLARLGAGDIFGETAFVDTVARSSDAFGDTPTELLILNPVAASALIARDQRLALALYWTFWKSLSSKLRQTNDRLTRFFAHATPRPTRPVEATPLDNAGFHVGLDAKQSLFREQRLSSLEINLLSTLSRERRLAPGEVLFREGDAGNEMYILLSGRVMISKYIPGAGEEALAFLERGDFFGEMALIDNQPRSADARAHDGEAVVLGIPRGIVDDLLDPKKVSSLRLLKLLASLLSKRLRELDDKIVGWFILAGGAGALPPEVQAD